MLTKVPLTYRFLSLSIQMFLLSDLFHSQPSKIAALDLGSNSFHMIIAEREHDSWKIIDRLKEPVRLGFGLQPDGSLTDEAQQRALDCLARFGERLTDFRRGSVKAVGTKTLREVTDAEAFLSSAQAALGHPIEIISGSEEARLIYLGVVHGLASIEGKRLVCDIGGGSTELIVGNEREVRFKESLSMGCVMLTLRYFSDGQIDKKRVKRALTYCAQQLEPVIIPLQRYDWENALGASGTIKAVAKVCAAMEWSEEGVISKQGLDQIVQAGIETGDIHQLGLKGLSSDREPVFYGGALVLKAVFDALNIDQMQPSPMALREGLLYEFLGRFDNFDVRDSAVLSLSKRFHVDQDHAERVSTSAIALWHQVKEDWQLNDPSAQKWLTWAAMLFEIGLDINHSSFHKHSAYIIANSDIAGFSQQEQQVLAAMVNAGRKKFSLKSLPITQQAPDGLWQLTLLFRLALTLNRARKSDELHLPRLHGDAKSLVITFAEGELEQYPLLAADLLSEAEVLANAGIDMVVG